MAEAFDLLLSELDSSKKKHVKAIKPVHADEGPEVEAEIDLALEADTSPVNVPLPHRADLALAHSGLEPLADVLERERCQRVG